MIRIATVAVAIALSGAATATAALAGATPAASGHAYVGSIGKGAGNPADLVVAANGRSIARLDFSFKGTCKAVGGVPAGGPKWGDWSSGPMAFTNVPVTASGLFQKTQTVTVPYPGDTGLTGHRTITLAGAFKAQAAAAGRLRGQIVWDSTQDGKEVAVCTAGPIRWAANDILGYEGKTSQGRLVDARFSAGVEKLTMLRAGLVERCSNGPYDYFGGWVNDPIAQGSFVDKGMGADGGVPRIDLGGGYTGYLTRNDLTGRFVSAGVVRGTIDLVMTVKDSSGKAVGTCKTGTVTWSARD